MTHTLDEVAAIIGDIVLQSTPTTDMTVGQVLEALAPGNGRAVGELLFAVAHRFAAITDEDGGDEAGHALASAY